MNLHGMRALRGVVMGMGLLGMVFWAMPARADVFSVTADLPLTFNLGLKGTGVSYAKDASSVSGFAAGVSLPFLVGIGTEQYNGDFKSASGVPKSKYTVSMYDIFLNLPIPVVDIVIGAGAGTGKLDVSGVKFKDADLTQVFASLGIPILPLVDVHLGYHSFSGKNKSSSAGVPDLTATGTMYSLGVKVGF